MLAILRNKAYAHLFAAQIVSLLGTGLATVALALLAFELAGDRAGVVLGVALTIKMIAYIGVSPLAGMLAARFDRRVILVSADLIRAAVALCLPFVDQVWQIYPLIFLLQAASAVFTPVYQATIPDILKDEADYTRALSLSRLAYDLENLLSPVFAAALLLVMSFSWLFVGTSLGFAVSAVLVMTARLPAIRPVNAGHLLEGALRGLEIFFKTPRLRGALALNFAVAAAGAMVIVNTVVIVRGLMGRGDGDVALAFGAYGAGSMMVALALPNLLGRVTDRIVMLLAALGLVVFMGVAAGIVTAGAQISWAILLGVWFALGAANSASLTPVGRVLRRSSQETDRPAVYAAQFGLSHTAWLITYPLAGWLGSAAGVPAAFMILGAVGLVGALAAWWLWPADEREIIPHAHPELAPDHPHLKKGRKLEGKPNAHAHRYVIDELHHHWPRRGV